MSVLKRVLADSSKSLVLVRARFRNEPVVETERPSVSMYRAYSAARNVLSADSGSRLTMPVGWSASDANSSSELLLPISSWR